MPGLVYLDVNAGVSLVQKVVQLCAISMALFYRVKITNLVLKMRMHSHAGTNVIVHLGAGHAYFRSFTDIIDFHVSKMNFTASFLASGNCTCLLNAS